MAQHPEAYHPGDSIAINRAYLDSLLVEGRILGAEQPSTEIRLFGETFGTPIMTAALSHLNLKGMARGAAEAGALVSIGMGSNEEMADVLSTGAKVMKIIKPYADTEEIISRISFAKEHGAVAVGMDVEHSVSRTSADADVVAGIPMKLPTLEELKRYIELSGLPFFIKGALSVRDAKAARDLGCAGVILSHHNGMMRYAVPPIRLLRPIREAVGRDLILIVDGGMEDGVDAFKALALGADLVTVGKAVMGPLQENGSDGVRDKILEMTREMQNMMIRTGTKDLEHMDPTVIWNA
ncbi:MAG: alpha-hydroxy-acid oxidizing protein [Clostridia bacterium]|nr:alpha-hydroxy-acid oxidizing protein [Clostridia bacterium]